MRAATPMFAEIVTYSQQMFAMISLPLFLNFLFDSFSRLSSSNLTPKTAEEKAKIAEEVKAKQLAEIEEKKKKREQVRPTISLNACRNRMSNEFAGKLLCDRACCHMCDF